MTADGKVIHRSVTSPRLKTGVYVLAGINSLATVYFFYYVPFYMRDRFGFGQLQNLELAAALGLTYAIFAFYGGRYAQRAGYFASFRLGVGLMIAAFVIASFVSACWVFLALIIVGNIGMCFTWPPLQGLMSEGESRGRLRTLVGFYNFTWAGMSAVAYSTGGAMHKAWGWQSLFYAPAALLVFEMIFSLWLERRINHQPPVPAENGASAAQPAEEPHHSPISSRTFLRMALLANPFAYLAINTIIPMIPTLAEKYDLNETVSGVVCSIWLFSRAGAFILLWLWPAWHYRFRFLAAAYAVMIVCFGAMCLADSLWVLATAQAILGVALGLVYYSALFYSMDVGETKGEHGGIHEAVIGIGSFGGPAWAAGALIVFPHQPSSGALSVCLLLLVGLAGLFWLRYRQRYRET